MAVALLAITVEMSRSGADSRSSRAGGAWLQRPPPAAACWGWNSNLNTGTTIWGEIANERRHHSIGQESPWGEPAAIVHPAGLHAIRPLPTFYTSSSGLQLPNTGAAERTGVAHFAALAMTWSTSLLW